MDANVPYKIEQYDENTSLIYFDDFEKNNVKFIFGEINKFKDHYVSVLYEEPFFNEDHWIKYFKGEEIGSWKTSNEKDAFNKLIEEFNYSFNFFHRQNIVLAMKYLNNKKNIIDKIQNYCRVNEENAYNIIYWKIILTKADIEKIVKIIEEMIPNEENAFMSKIIFVSNLTEKLKK